MNGKRRKALWKSFKQAHGGVNPTPSEWRRWKMTYKEFKRGRK